MVVSQGNLWLSSGEHYLTGRTLVAQHSLGRPAHLAGNGQSTASGAAHSPTEATPERVYSRLQHSSPLSDRPCVGTMCLPPGQRTKGHSNNTGRWSTAGGGSTPPTQWVSLKGKWPTRGLLEFLEWFSYCGIWDMWLSHTLGLSVLGPWLPSTLAFILLPSSGTQLMVLLNLETFS